MAPTHAAARLSRPLISQASSTICLRCQFRSLVSPQYHRSPASLPKTARRYASTSTWSQRLWGKNNPSALENITAAGKSEDQDVDQAQAEDAPRDYKPATSWEGLPSIGGNQGNQWDREHVWEGFMSVTKLQSKEDISAAIYRALVEVFTLRDAGMEVVIPNAVGDDRGVEAISTARIVQGEHGVPTVTYASAELQQEAFAALMPIPEEEAVAPEDVVREAKGIEDEEIVEEIETEAHNEEVLRAEEQASEIQAQEEDVFESEEQGGDEAMAATVTQATTPVKASVKRKAEWLVFFNDVPTGQWVNTAFPTAEVKFAVLKRVMQLTGRRIPDPAIQDINSAKALLGHLVEKPKPPKLAERLTLNEQLLELPNVQLRKRRVTPIDKEKQLGRWKVIEEELKRRDLPVTGHI